MPNLNYDNPQLDSVIHRDTPKEFRDNEGNVYTPEQVRAASEQMAKDETGNGSLGGLTEGEDGTHLTTADTTPATTPPAAPHTRELNPSHFGQFFKDNVFGGLDAKYVTGKRPMTAFDYTTDVLGALGGENIGKRNATLIKTNIENTKNQRETDLAGERIKTSQAARQKTNVETDKLAGDAIQKMMHDLDSDLWAGELKNFQKQHGVTLRPGVVSMVERMATKLSEAGVSHPADVLENPDRFEPGLVNRVRHTMTLVNKDFAENQKAQQAQEKSNQALGLRPGEEQRKSEKNAQEQTGISDAIDLLTKQMADTDDRAQRQHFAGQIATLRAGGTAAQDVLKELSGVGKPPAVGRAWTQTRDAAIAELMKENAGKPNYQPGADEVKNRMGEIENRISTQGAVQKNMGTAVAKGRVAVTKAISLVNDLRDAVKNYGLSTGSVAAHTGQPFRRMIADWTGDPKYAPLVAFPGLMGQLARGISGETGVLTDRDLDRINTAVAPRTGFLHSDTQESYDARITFVETAMKRAQAALEAADKTGQPPVPIDMSDVTFPGDSLPSASTKPANGPANAGSTDLKAFADRIRAEPDPEKKRQMAVEYKRMKEGG